MTTPTSGAADHLWLHFSRLADATDEDLIVIERGEGAYVYDTRGRRYLDGLAGLFTVQVGHGRQELAAAAAKQAETLAYFPLWTHAHPAGLALADKLVSLAPDNIRRVFFTSGGSEAVESAWKLARSYFLLIGQPERHKVISRHLAYHGTTLGALSITGIPGLRDPFAPMLNGATRHARNTDLGTAEECAADIERCIVEEGPDSVAAVFLEPVQNAGGCFPPPPGYFQAVREICDRHGVLLVSDEVICGFGRLGAWFGAQRLDYRADMITFAKGVTSGYSPLGGVLVSDRVTAPFEAEDASFVHGITFGGHPVSCAVGLANVEIMEREDLPGNVRRHEAELLAAVESLTDLPIVSRSRGLGYFVAAQLKNDGAPFTPEQIRWLVREHLPRRLLEAGLHCRVDDRSGDPAILLSPPLIVGSAEIDEMRTILRRVLEEAWQQLP